MAFPAKKIAGRVDLPPGKRASGAGVVKKGKTPGSGKIKPMPEAEDRDSVYQAAKGLAKKGGAFTKKGKPKGL